MNGQPLARPSPRPENRPLVEEGWNALVFHNSHVVGYVTAEHEVLLPCASEREGLAPKQGLATRSSGLSTVDRVRPAFKKTFNDTKVTG